MKAWQWGHSLFAHGISHMILCIHCPCRLRYGLTTGEGEREWSVTYSDAYSAQCCWYSKVSPAKCQGLKGEEHPSNSTAIWWENFLHWGLSVHTRERREGGHSSSWWELIQMTGKRSRIWNGAGSWFSNYSSSPPPFCQLGNGSLYTEGVMVQG